MVLLSRRFGDAGAYMVAWDFRRFGFNLGITKFSEPRPPKVSKRWNPPN